jgi:hypothetical protein
MAKKVFSANDIYIQSVTSPGIYWTHNNSTSKIYEDGQLRISTDDNLYLTTSETVNRDSNTRIELKAGSIVIPYMQPEIGGGINLWWSTAEKRLFAPTSSIRFKKNIIELPSNIYNLNTFMKMKPILYAVKAETETDNPNKKSPFAGFIAEELDELGFTEFVCYVDNAPYSIYYERLNVFTTKIVQEQQKIIDIQTKQIQELINTTNQIKIDLEKLQKT